MICSHCKRDLPKEAFSPSRIKLRYPVCKECENTKEKNRRIKAILDDENESKFDSLYGGYVVAILNHVRSKEYKYTIKGTNGYMIQTNDVDYFRKKMDELIAQ